MQIECSHLDAHDLETYGREAVALLTSGDLEALGSRFGYALAFGRRPSEAIRAALEESLTAIGATALDHQPVEPCVKFFEPSDTGLLAVIECLVATDSGSDVLVELVVTGTRHESHITLEQVSAVT